VKRTETIKFLIIRSIGNFLVLFALFGVFATFGPALYYEVQFRVATYRGVTYSVAKVVDEEIPKEEVGKEASFADILAGQKEHILIPKDTDFSILIPKIGANAKVFPNVDPSNSDAFIPLLSKGVAHAKGTVFPGISGNTYLFAHSTDSFWNVGRYNAIFYLLKDLTVGDDIVVFFEGLRHNYKVTEVRVVEAEDVSFITESQNGDEEVLILQTCWPPGTTWKRLLVFAKKTN